MGKNSDALKPQKKGMLRHTAVHGEKANYLIKIELGIRHCTVTVMLRRGQGPFKQCIKKHPIWWRRASLTDKFSTLVIYN